MPCLKEAYVSLATNDYYAIGALTLGKSIRDTGTNRRLALMVTSGVSDDMRQGLLGVWDELVDVVELNSGDAKNLALLSRPELGVTFTKINAWTLTQYSKCVYLDADTLVMQNIDELFDREELSASPDIGWPDCFNSGVFVFQPLDETFRSLMQLSKETGSFDGGDQGLLNLYWSDWATKDIKYHLPFVYNVTPNVTYGYAPAFQRFSANIKIIHFIGPIKPWQHNYVKEMDSIVVFPGTYASQSSILHFIKRWWQVYTSLEQDQLLPGSASMLGILTHRQEFESGLIDYSGRDSFDKIREHMDSWMGPPPVVVEQKRIAIQSQKDANQKTSKPSITPSKTTTKASTQPKKMPIVPTKSTSTNSTTRQKSGASKSTRTSAVQQKTSQPPTTTVQRKTPKTLVPNSTSTTTEKTTSNLSSGSGGQKQVTCKATVKASVRSVASPKTLTSSPTTPLQKTTSSISSPTSGAQKQVTPKAARVSGKPIVGAISASSPKTATSSPTTPQQKTTSSISSPTSGAQKQVTPKAARVTAKPSVGATSASSPKTSTPRPTSTLKTTRCSSFSSPTTQKGALKAIAKPDVGTAVASPKTSTPSSRPTSTPKTTRGSSFSSPTTQKGALKATAKPDVGTTAVASPKTSTLSQKSTRSMPVPGSKAHKLAASSKQPLTKKITSPTTKMGTPTTKMGTPTTKMGTPTTP